jgi:lysine 2,3-aminomutase
MKSHRLISLTSSVNEENESEPPDRYSPSGEITFKKIEVKSSAPGIPVSKRAQEFMRYYYKDIGILEWNDWQWQLRNSFTSLRQLGQFLRLSESELFSVIGKQKPPLRITPYYASLIDPNNPAQAIRRTMVPVQNELLTAPEEKIDPLEEEHQSPTPQIVHRYPDRVLFLATGVCAAYCRYCTRTHLVSKKEKSHCSIAEWDAAIDYIRQHKEVRDVLISGGDPLTMSDNRIEYLLSRLRKIPHVEILRIGTKVPVVLPQRITTSLVETLKKYHPLFMSIHLTHPDEITPEVAFACKKLADAGIPLGSQTVLLKGINDNVETFTKLTHELLKIRVRPYYLYQCDLIPGSSHFRTSVAKGLELIKGLRGFTSGYAIPHFVIDAPGGGGKIPLLPEYVTGKDENGYILVNYEGKTYHYPDPSE